MLPDLPVEYRLLAEDNLHLLKTLNSVIFPIKYHDQVYKDAAACGDVTQLAFQGSTLIGAIVARLEAQPQGTAKLYIVSLGVLAPHRSLGLGSNLLQRSLSACEGDEAITEAYLHVHSGNEEAIRFYERHGFSVQQSIRGYYKRLQPPDAVVLSRQLNNTSSNELI